MHHLYHLGPAVSLSLISARVLVAPSFFAELTLEAIEVPAPLCYPFHLTQMHDHLLPTRDALLPITARAWLQSNLSHERCEVRKSQSQGPIDMREKLRLTQAHRSCDLSCRTSSRQSCSDRVLPRNSSVTVSECQ